MIFVLTIAGLTVSAWLVFSWFEAQSEVEVLCTSFQPGTNEQSVVRTLETGQYLRYETTKLDVGKRIDVDSPYNLGTSKCVIVFTNRRGIKRSRRVTQTYKAFKYAPSAGWFHRTPNGTA